MENIISNIIIPQSNKTVSQIEIEIKEADKNK